MQLSVGKQHNSVSGSAEPQRTAALPHPEVVFKIKVHTLKEFDDKEETAKQILPDYVSVQNGDQVIERKNNPLRLKLS